ncbi:MAG: type II restriction endonuclease [Sedimentisphaerales bacterium]
MNYTGIFKNRIDCDNSQEVFDYLISSLKETITNWDFFVNWAKVFKGIKNIEVDLNILNYLIGKDNIEQEFKSLINEHPSIVHVMPILIACRETKFKILTDFSNNGIFQYEDYDFSRDSNISKDKVVEFAIKTGFLNLLKDKKLKNIVDYVIGVEVGLDSNGRKNRGGSAMERIVEFYVKNVCEKNKFDYLREATSKEIKNKWGINLKVDKSSRRIDFVIKKGNSLALIETNFYSGGGSKLKSTAGEYKSMYDFWKKDGRCFIWITDGAGWKKTKLPLQETFEHTDYILNLDMVSKGLLEDIILNY